MERLRLIDLVCRSCREPISHHKGYTIDCRLVYNSRQELCCLERNDILSCSLAKDHHGDHQAYGSHRLDPAWFVERWKNDQEFIIQEEEEPWSDCL